MPDSPTQNVLDTLPDMLNTAPSSPITTPLSSEKSDPPTPRKRKQVKNACGNLILLILNHSPTYLDTHRFPQTKNNQSTVKRRARNVTMLVLVHDVSNTVYKTLVQTRSEKNAKEA